MAAIAANSLNISSTGVPYFNGSAFSAPSLTEHGVILGGASNAIKSLGAMTNGQLVIGSTGADPVVASLTSTGSTITITAGAGSINLESALSIGAFSSTPTAAGLSLSGASLVLHAADATNPGAVSTGSQTFAGVKTLSSAPIFSTLTGVLSGNGSSAVSASAVTQYAVAVGNGSNGLAFVGPGSAGQVLTSNGAGANPSFQTAPAAGFMWTSISSAPTTADKTGYMATAALSIALPSAPSDGYTVGLLNASAGAVLFQAAGSDVIQVGSAASAAAGSATSSVKGDSAVLVYQASGATWFAAPGVQGIWSVV